MFQRPRGQFQAGKEAKIEIYFFMVERAVIQATNTRDIKIMMMGRKAQAICLSIARAARSDFQNTVLYLDAGILKIAGNSAKRMAIAHAFRHGTYYRAASALGRNNAGIN